MPRHVQNLRLKIRRPRPYGLRKRRRRRPSRRPPHQPAHQTRRRAQRPARGGSHSFRSKPLRRLSHLERIRAPRVRVKGAKGVTVRSSRQVAAIVGEAALELVEDAVALVQVAQLGAKMLVNLELRHGFRIHVYVPELHREVIPGQDVPAVPAELDVRDARDDLAEERPGSRGFLLVENLGVVVAQSAGSHIRKANGTLRARVREQVALVRVELRGRDDLGEVLHVVRLDVHDVEAAPRRLQVPQVDP
mmetsp:Transcript_844/g.3850  ORF Transcript_844/g.3850 Transcript_844/m.3850 type:complete len:248 (-) Transcript_844:901-1644(-)